MSDGLRVLLVDDDDVYWDLAQLAIGRARLDAPPNVQRVRSGSEALAYLADANRELPQLVLLDQRMPTMDGTEWMAHVQGHAMWKAIPVGFMSSSDQRELISEAYQKGASFFVVKPIAFSELTEKFRAIFEFWAGVAEPPPA